MAKVPRKVRFVKATSDQQPENAETRVVLERTGTGTFVGTSATGGSDREVFLAGARAAAQAVEQAAGGGGASVEVEDIEVTSAVGHPVVIVSVVASYKGEIRNLFGICRVKPDRATSAALAVLSATNRIFDLG